MTAATDGPILGHPVLCVAARHSWVTEVRLPHEGCVHTMENHSEDALRKDVNWLRSVSAHLAQNDSGEDFAQDAWLAAQRAQPAEGPGRRAWLKVVSRNFARMARRRRVTADAHQWRLQESDGPPSTESAVHERRVVDAVRDAMQELTEADRNILERRFLHDESVAEIAEALELKAGAVRTRVSRALQRVRARLDEQYGGREAWANALLVVSLQPVQTARWLIPCVATALVATALLGAWRVGRDAGSVPDSADTRLAASAHEDVSEAATAPTQAPANPTSLAAAAAPAERSPRPTSVNSVAAPPSGDEESLAVAAQALFKSVAKELGEVASGCFGDVPDDGSGVIVFSIHVQAAHDIGAVIDMHSLSSDTTNDEALEECLEGSIPAFRLEKTPADLDQALRFKVDLDRRVMYVHGEIVVDDVDAYVEHQREMGAPDDLVERLRERLRKSPVTTTGVAFPFDAQEIQP